MPATLLGAGGGGKFGCAWRPNDVICRCALPRSFRHCRCALHAASLHCRCARGAFRRHRRCAVLCPRSVAALSGTGAALCLLSPALSPRSPRSALALPVRSACPPPAPTLCCAVPTIRRRALRHRRGAVPPLSGTVATLAPQRPRTAAALGVPSAGTDAALRPPVPARSIRAATVRSVHSPGVAPVATPGRFDRGARTAPPPL
jgi:hypothetical protein